MEAAFDRKGEDSHSSFIIVPQESDGGRKQILSSQATSLPWEEVVGAAQVFDRWVAQVRMRSGKVKPSGFPHLLSKSKTVPRELLMEEKSSATEVISEEPRTSADNTFHLYQALETSLWERLGTAATLNIESNAFTWSCLSSLHHIEYSSSSEPSEDELNKALEVTVNSGGVVFFALFNNPENSVILPKEAAAVIKITSSRLTTLSERLGYEFARCLGVRTPQARVVHNFSPEWQYIKDATGNACKGAILAGDQVGELTCSELLEALEMSRCVLLMNYVHGSPLLKNLHAFDTPEAAGNTATALGRILLLDLVLRNEDRLPCHQLGWRGNPGNLLYVDKIVSEKLNQIDEIHSLSSEIFNPTVVNVQKNGKANSINRREHLSQRSVSLNEITRTSSSEQENNVNEHADFIIVAIDNMVPRRPPAGKCAKDQEQYSRLVELVLNNSDYSSNLLHEISGGNLGFSASQEADIKQPCSSTSFSLSYTDMMAVVHKFQGGFHDALMDLQSFHSFLLTLHQKLEGLFRIISSMEISSIESHADFNDYETHKNSPGFSPRGVSECGRSPNSTSNGSRENSSGKYSKWSGDQFHRLRLTMKLREFHKLVKVDAELHKEFEQWLEMLRTDVVKYCQDNHFITGFFDGNDNNIAVDAYELKVRLEHILDRITLISDAKKTEQPSQVTDNLFIGGDLAARSVHTLKYLGITHILCFCINEIGVSDSQHPELFKYKNFSINDRDEADISSLFEEACDFIATVAHSGGKVLVHCFEGKSRSATVVLAYLMMKKGHTLSEAWNILKKLHRRSQPNDGFAEALLKLDRRLHGKVSMDWKRRKPVMQVCPICGKNLGLNTNSLKLHLQKVHNGISSVSVDSGMTMEIQKIFEELKNGDAGNDPIQSMSRSISHTYL